MSIALALPVLSSVVWIGGMIFSQVALTVAVNQLQPSQRAPFMVAVLDRFFLLVWVAVIILPITGYGIVFVFYGGMQHVGLHIHLMSGLGMLMVSVYFLIYLWVFLPLNKALAAGEADRAGLLMKRLRQLMWANLILGVAVVSVVPVADPTRF